MASDDVEHRLQARRPSAGSSSARSQEAKAAADWSRLEMVKAEIAQLKDQLAEHGTRREKLTEQLQSARATEGEERQRLELSRTTEQEKRQQLRARFQKAVRSVVREQRAMAAIATPSPELHALANQLEDQLNSLHHQLHGLKFGQADRERGATKLQAWWRCILAKRVARCLRINHTMWQLLEAMNFAAMRIQSWHRATSIRRRWRSTIEVAMRDWRKSEEVRLQDQLRVVRVLQKAIRVYLAKKRMAKQLEAGGPQLIREATDETGAKMMRYVDNWRPAGEKRQLRDGMPQKDPELVKMEEAGLIPFYSNNATDTIRHRIGGPFALKIQRQLGVGQGAHLNRFFEDSTSPRSRDEPVAATELEDEASEGRAKAQAEDAQVMEAAEEPREGGARTSATPKLVRPFMFKTQAELLSEDNVLGANWDIYPEGLSEGFLKTLTYDLGPAPKKPPKKTRPKRLTCTKPLDALPTRTKKRAEARESAQAEADRIEAKVNALAAVAHLEHPMLEGLLSLPNIPMYPMKPMNPQPPPGPPPGRARPGLILLKEDCSWADATNFYHEGRTHRHSNGRSGTGWRVM